MERHPICPLCHSRPTLFMYTEEVERPFLQQVCSNVDCELPCKLWKRVRKLIVCETMVTNQKGET